jgi:hypothetical protein
MPPLCRICARVIVDKGFSRVHTPHIAFPVPDESICPALVMKGICKAGSGEETEDMELLAIATVPENSCRKTTVKK